MIITILFELRADVFLLYVDYNGDYDSTNGKNSEERSFDLVYHGRRRQSSYRRPISETQCGDYKAQRTVDKVSGIGEFVVRQLIHQRHKLRC